MSASCPPTLSVWTKARLKNVGMPMLSLMVSTSSGGMIWRIRFSTAPTMRSVSSSRVPTGARTWRRICPASTLGKKSVPTTSASPTALATTSAPQPSTNGRCASASDSARP